MIRVATYNVLAQSMTHYIKVEEPEHLTWEHRAANISRDLRQLVDEHYLIALQEVDLTMEPAVRAVFSGADYIFVKSHYSTPERARFGVWLCIPARDFRVLESGMSRIGSLIPVPDDTTDAQPPARQPDTNTNTNVFVEAHKRNNQLVYALLRHVSGFEFIFAGWHSPCAFWWPAVMTLSHAALKAELDRLRLSLGREYLLAGDFNIVPGSAHMDFMLSGHVADEVRPAASWEPPPAVSLVPVVSGHQVTCWNGDFSGALDHVFVSSGFPLIASVSLVPQLTGSIPDADHGSDHVPVRAGISVRL